MRFGYTIFYVQDVLATVAFYEQAFGLACRFVSPDRQYAEMETGSTALAFAALSLAEANGISIHPANPQALPAACEIAFITSEPEAALARAVMAGCVQIKPVAEKPWGQTVGYVRDFNGFLVEIGSPVASG